MGQNTLSYVAWKLKTYLDDEKSKFPWSKMVDEKEMRFVYDIVSRSETDRHFIPTAAQAKWGLAILSKLNASKLEWESKKPKVKRKKYRHPKKA